MEYWNYQLELEKLIEFKLQLIVFAYLPHLDLPILEHNQNPSDSYDHLRKIVHTIAQEVIKLPEFYNQKGFSSVDAKQVQSSFEPKVYEDLLATAVINKVKIETTFIIPHTIKSQQCDLYINCAFGYSN